jgi:hypothetical protein
VSVSLDGVEGGLGGEGNGEGSGVEVRVAVVNGRPDLQSRSSKKGAAAARVR